MIKTNWDKLEDVFPDIINNNSRYKLILENILLSSNNKLLYTPIGFPIDSYLNTLLIRLFNITAPFNKTEHIWEKNITYVENQHYLFHIPYNVYMLYLNLIHYYLSYLLMLYNYYFVLNNLLYLH